MQTKKQILEILEEISHQKDDKTVINNKIESILNADPGGILYFKQAVDEFNLKNDNLIPQSFIDYYLDKYDNELDRTKVEPDTVNHDDSDITQETDSTKTEVDDDQDITKIVVQNNEYDNVNDDKTIVSSNTTDDDITANQKINYGNSTNITQATDVSMYDLGKTVKQGSLDVGSVIKSRFKLEKLLGVGGMGKVYKALDLIKHEAQNKQPYIAIKLLTDEFRQHENSFVILEREASKSQRLAHPNIATVFDFDREESTGTIYITMEILDGMELKQYIKRKVPKNKGLPFSRMWPIIEGLSNALGYAHKNNLIHSDFKPGNAFLSENQVTGEQVVKVIDFGISRASGSGNQQDPDENHDFLESRKKDDGQSEDFVDLTSEVSESTLFDPSSMNALTPAYASYEMHLNHEPDPSDDIYALGCVCYELLVGTHPFKKATAVTALEKNLKPASLDASDLTLLQKKTLEKSISILRKDRIKTIDEFLKGIVPRVDYSKEIIAGSLLSMAILGATTFSVYANKQTERHNNTIIAKLSSLDEEKIYQGFDQLSSATGGTSSQLPKILSQSRRPLLSFLRLRVSQLFNPVEGLYNYVQASHLIQRVSKYYPDSSEVNELDNNITNVKNKIIFDELIPQRDNAIKNKRYHSVGNKIGLKDILRKAHAIEPVNSLIIEEGILVVYDAEVKQLIKEKKFDDAYKMLTELNGYLPNNSTMSSLLLATQSAEDLHRRDMIISQYSITDLLAELKNDQISSVALDLIELYVLSEDIKLANDRKKILKTVSTMYEKIDNPQQRYDFLLKYPKLFTINQYAEHKMNLPAELFKNSGFEANLELFKEQILNSQSLDYSDTSKTIEIVRAYKKLFIKTENDSQIASLNTAFQNSISKQYELVLRTNQFSQAESIINLASKLYNSRLYVNDLTKKLDKSKSVFIAKATKRKNDLEIERNIRYLESAISANRIITIETYYKKLKSLLAADPSRLDKYNVNIANAYAVSATRALDQQDVSTTSALIASGRQYDASNSQLLAIEVKLKIEIKIRNILASITELNEVNFNQITEIRRELGNKSSQIKDFERRVSLHSLRIIEVLKRSGKILTAWNLKESAIAAFPNVRELARIGLPPKPKPAVYASRGISALEKGLLSQAEGLLRQAEQSESQHPQTIELSRLVSARKNQAIQYFTRYESFLNQRNIEGANQSIKQAAQIWSDNETYEKALKNQGKYSKLISKGAKICFSSFKGYGKRNAICNDVLITQQNKRVSGPVLIVIPENKNKGIDIPLVFGKYEVSVDEFNLYCSETGSCDVITDKDGRLPIVGVSLEQINSYLDWLSNQTEYDYRLATLAEWQYAASADGTEVNQDYNCVSTSGGRIIKGQAVSNISSGSSNRWGLINYVGNVDEYVIDSTGNAVLAGGNHTDPYLRCKTDLVKPISEVRPSLAGFRVVRALY